PPPRARCPWKGHEPPDLARRLAAEVGSARGHFFSFFFSSTVFLTSTGSVLIVRATFPESFLTSRPLGSQPAATATILPPLSIRKLVGMVLVSNTFQLSPLVSTA